MSYLEPKHKDNLLADWRRRKKIIFIKRSYIVEILVHVISGLEGNSGFPNFMSFLSLDMCDPSKKLQACYEVLLLWAN